jgi:hypothetical protein
VDLSFTRFDRDLPVAILPTELAALLAGVAARQAASATARIQTGLEPSPPGSLLTPAGGRFSDATAAALIGWQEE